MQAQALPVLAVAVFLALAGFYHLLAPAHSERILSKVWPIRSVGTILSFLGGWCLLVQAPVAYAVGIPTILSGLARLLAPRRMITVNTWTSRYGHGVLMLLGAFSCVALQLVWQ
jgi:hypothetical protein